MPRYSPINTHNKPKNMKTKQEILNSHPFLQTWIENPDDSVIRCCNEEQVLWAMDEYAKSLLPSDKEISKANKEIFKNFFDKKDFETWDLAFNHCAKWLKQEILNKLK